MTLIEISLETGVASVEKTVVLSKTASDVNPACSIMAVFKHEVCGRTRNVGNAGGGNQDLVLSTISVLLFKINAFGELMLHFS